jgi:Tol biopolymer transport system component
MLLHIAARTKRAVAVGLLAGAVLAATASASFPGKDGAILAMGPPIDVSELATMFYVTPGGGEPRMLGLGQYPVWAPSGKVFAFATWRKIYVATTDGYSLTSHRRLITVQEPIQLWELSWFPGGRRLAYVALNKNTNTSDIHTLDVRRGRHRSRLTFARKGWTNGEPAVSPTGGWIAYTQCGREGDACNLRLMRTNGTDQHTIVSVPPWRVVRPLWSPGGRRIAFSLCGVHRCSGWIYDPSTRKRRRVPGEGIDAFAPDGAHLVVFDRLKGRHECEEGLFVTDLYGKHRRLLPGDCLAFVDWAAR